MATLKANADLRNRRSPCFEFVSRAKSKTRFRCIYSAPVDRSTGIICDQAIALTGTISRKDYPVHLRRIRFKYPETGKTVVFLTVKKFDGNSENAVKSQIWNRIAASVTLFKKTPFYG